MSEASDRISPFVIVRFLFITHYYAVAWKCVLIFCAIIYFVRFNTEQLDKLADLSLSLAKGLFLAALAAPAFSQISAIFAFKSGAIAVVLALISLKIIETKEVYK